MPALQSLRFLFVMAVLLSHLQYDSTTPTGHTYPFLGEGSVAFFFMLSGYVLSFSWGKRLEEGGALWSTFMRSRIRKVYPLHVICLGLYVLTLIRHLDLLEPRVLIASLFLVQSWIPDHAYYYGGNAVAWYLSTLLLCYALFPWFYKLLFRSKRRTLFLASTFGAMMYGALLLFNSDAEAYVYVAPYSRLADFALGIIMARHMATSYKPVGWGSKVVALLLWGIAVILCRRVPEAVGVCCIYWPACLALIRCYGVRKVADEQPAAWRKALRQLGNLSFPFYMIHIIVLSIVCNIYEHLFHTPTPVLLAFLLTMGGSLLFAKLYQVASHSILTPRVNAQDR